MSITTRFGERNLLDEMESRDASDVFTLDGSSPPLIYKCVYKHFGDYEGNHAIRRAYKICKHLGHPNLSCILDTGECPDHFYLLEWKEAGTDLFAAVDALQDKKLVLPSDQVLHITKSLLRGMKHLHAQGLVHRDIKCENILLSQRLPITPTRPPQKLPNVMLTDWEYLAPFGEIAGIATPLYGSPTAGNNQPYTYADDMWSFGVVLYVLLMGCAPWRRPRPHDIRSNFRTELKCGLKMPDAAITLLTQIWATSTTRETVPKASDVLVGEFCNMTPQQLDEMRFESLSKEQQVTPYYSRNFGK